MIVGLFGCLSLLFCICPAPLIGAARRALAELSFHKAMGWPLPKNNLDLFIEHRNATNGRNLPQGKSLIGALILRHLDSIGSETKELMRDLILRGGLYADDEIAAILDYCESDVAALLRLLTVMLPTIDLPRALLRGRYMNAVACMEHAGIPLDVATLNELKTHWKAIQAKLIAEVDKDFDVYEGNSFKAKKMEAYLERTQKLWPLLTTGKLDLKEQTFRDAANDDPQLKPLYDLRVTLASMRACRLAVGVDGRNRFMISLSLPERHGISPARRSPSLGRALGSAVSCSRRKDMHSSILTGRSKSLVRLPLSAMIPI